MPRNGSGVYSAPAGSFNPAVSGTTVVAADWNALLTDLVAAIPTYLEGTFTPSLLFGGASVGMTYTAQSGVYTRIGNRLLFELNITLSAKGSSVGAATISGLPLAQNGGTVPVIPFRVSLVTTNVAGSFYSVVGQIALSSSAITLSQQGNNVAITNLTDAEFVNTSNLRCSGQYSV